MADNEIRAQWNLLAKITALTGTPPARVGDQEFTHARAALLQAYRRRGSPESGRNIAGVFNQLQLTLFNAGRLSTWQRPSDHQPVAVTGWSTVAPALAETAMRYIGQVRLSLRPNTVKHIEHDLRRFATWTTTTYPEVSSCADPRGPSHSSGWPYRCGSFRKA